MRADYATSDLISKVNDEWINEVLANREFDRADPGGDVPRDDVARDVADDVGPDTVDVSNSSASDLRLRREFARKRTMMRRRGSTGTGRHEPDIAVEPLARRTRRRSVARRVKERLVLAIALLMLVGVGLWMAPEPQDATTAASAQTTNALPEAAGPINTAEVQPAWLQPEILFGPAMARSPAPRTEAPRPMPRPAR
jgi:hypothetical protein